MPAYTAELRRHPRRAIKALLATVAVSGLLAALPQAAGAADGFPGFGGGGIGVGVPSNGLGASPCGTGVAGGMGSPAAPAVCAGGLSFVGPTIGQIASVIGPTIISPAVVGNTIIVASGTNVVAPGGGAIP
jgi:hypothetical protein